MVLGLLPEGESGEAMHTSLLPREITACTTELFAEGDARCINAQPRHHESRYWRDHILIFDTKKTVLDDDDTMTF